MATSHKSIAVTEMPNCDFCEKSGVKREAKYDGLTTLGAWAYMCETHFLMLGKGLGLGLGQRLLLEK